MSLFDIISLAPQSRIGTIEIPAVLEEIHTDTLQTTEHPVEIGAAITDHAFVRPREVVIRCGWSNSTVQGFLSAIKSMFSESKPNGRMTASDFVSSVYETLLVLQESRQPLAITTSKRQYSDMLIIGLQVTTDQRTGNALIVQATCREIIIVQTKATTLPPKESQANPAKTAGIENTGYKQCRPMTPINIGSKGLLGMS